MVNRYTLTEARTNFAAIIHQVEGGMEIVVTRRGKTVAFLAPVRAYDRLEGSRRGFAEAYRGFLDAHSLDEFGIKDDFASSVREKSLGRTVSL